MAQYRIELATPADDVLLRQALAAAPMPGAISLRFQRDPSYFAAGVVEGTFRQVLVARHLPTQTIAALGCRSGMLRYVNGQPTPVGYLSNLRALPGHRGRTIVGRGYRFLQQLHADGQAKLYLTTVAEDNSVALSLLTSGRAGLPQYHAAGRFHTAVLSARRPLRRVSSLGHAFTIRAAQADDKQLILDFIRRVGPARQFFPCYQSGDLFAAGGLLHGLAPHDLLLAFRGQELVGTLGAWDQTSFRQNVIHGYSGPLHWLRSGYNVWASLRGLPRLPRVGAMLRSRLAVLPLVAAEDEAVFGPLLNSLLEHVRASDAEQLLVGLHEADPLLPHLRQYAARWYTTAVYLVCWPDGQAMRSSLDDRPPYLELGAL